MLVRLIKPGLSAANCSIQDTIVSYLRQINLCVKVSYSQCPIISRKFIQQVTFSVTYLDSPLVCVPVHACDLSLHPPGLLLALSDELPHILNHSVHLDPRVTHSVLDTGI